MSAKATLPLSTSRSHSRNAVLIDGKPSGWHPAYHVHRNILRRCYDSTADAYPWYGGKNPPITVCDRWRFGEGGKPALQCFVDDMGPRPFKNAQVDRIESDRPYSPDNCRWISPRENSRRSGSATLTRIQVAVIKRRILNGEHDNDITADFPVQMSTINRIRNGRRWTDVPAAEPDSPFVNLQLFAELCWRDYEAKMKAKAQS